MSSNEATGPYRLGERIGTSVWRAEDTRSGKPVALKVLTKQLPKEIASEPSEPARTKVRVPMLPGTKTGCPTVR